MTLTAHVKAGRLIADEPTDLPEGTAVELTPVEVVTPEDRERLREMIAIGLAQAQRGETVDGPTSMAEGRAKLQALILARQTPQAPA